MAFLSEAQLETALLEQMVTLGYACASDEFIGPDGKQPEREAYDEVVLKARLAAAVARLNPALPPEAQADAIRRLTQSELPNLLEENRHLHRLLTEGADVEYYAEDGTLTAGKVRLIDFDNPANNDWLAVRQFTVIAGQIKRRPDVVVFVNGLPLAVIELKAPGDENATLAGAFNPDCSLGRGTMAMQQILQDRCCTWFLSAGIHIVCDTRREMQTLLVNRILRMTKK